jgi:hypothetical protein
MLVNFTKKSFKSSLKKMDSSLTSKGFNIPHHIKLEALSVFFGYKNWNILSEKLEDKNQGFQSVQLFKNETEQNIRVLQIKTKSSIEKIKELLFLSGQKSNFDLDVSFIEKQDLDGIFYFVFDLSYSDKNYLTFITLFLNEIENQNIVLDSFIVTRKTVEKEKVI